jgi:predicted aspartyl protease
MTLSKLKSIAILVALFLSSAGCAVSEKTGATSIPFKIGAHDHIIVDLKINGLGPYAFIADTAASGMVVFENLVEEADLSASDSSDVIEMQSAGALSEVRLVGIGKVNLGGVEFDVPDAIVIDRRLADDGIVHGILGADVLLRQPLGVFYSTRQLILFGDGPRSYEDDVEYGGWSRMQIHRLDEQAPFYGVELMVDGARILALIDTGAKRSIINTPGMQSLGAERAALAEAESVRGTGNAEVAALTRPTTAVSLGEWSLAGHNLVVADPPVLKAMGFSDQPFIILGADILGRLDFIVDAQAEQILFRPFEKAPN